ncbi:MAG: hypothetical protein IT277_06100 [Ignavibacteriaceae bacterium]|jgi:hypothetical protein|nr:hypothetical protein [Ignavibacteriaceae bacterium]
MSDISKFFADNKDLFTIIVATFAGLVALGTFIKAILEYRLQGRQKRAELFDKFKTTLKTEPRIVNINSQLENDSATLTEIPLIDRYYFLGYYEQIAIAVNSGLIDKDVAHYMFGYFALHCWDSTNFWNGINRQSYYWSVFKKFVDTMQELENRNLNKSWLTKLWDNLTGRSNFKY